jgi:hypothetical protein
VPRRPGAKRPDGRGCRRALGAGEKQAEDQNWPVEQRYRAVLEVLDGSPVSEVAIPVRGVPAVGVLVEGPACGGRDGRAAGGLAAAADLAAAAVQVVNAVRRAITALIADADTRR